MELDLDVIVEEVRELIENGVIIDEIVRLFISLSEIRFY